MTGNVPVTGARDGKIAAASRVSVGKQDRVGGEATHSGANGSANAGLQRRSSPGSQESQETAALEPGCTKAGQPSQEYRAARVERSSR